MRVGKGRALLLCPDPPKGETDLTFASTPAAEHFGSKCAAAG